ncbi:MAG: hypothetical protein EOO77_30465 [Oxalobacteraceae bacterium]|nr:MAG: hypothetical protein EOO77_30465 [Oxalobacteraceae bacterium]
MTGNGADDLPSRHAAHFEPCQGQGSAWNAQADQAGLDQWFSKKTGLAGLVSTPQLDSPRLNHANRWAIRRETHGFDPAKPQVLWIEALDHWRVKPPKHSHARSC